MENSVFTYFNSLDEHEHICHLYYEDSECYEIATSFILNALECNNRCVYLSNRPVPQELLSRLRGHGILKSRNSKGRVFDEIIVNNPLKEANKAEALVRKIESEIEGVLKSSNSPVRFIMMHSDNSYFLTNSDRLWKKACLNRICLEKPIILMNQFHVDRLGSKDVLSILKTHPTIVEQSRVYSSPLYLKPEHIINDLEKESEKIKDLSRKEIKVPGLIIDGLSNSGIAKEMSISVKTVETHRANIMKKLGYIILLTWLNFL